MGNWCGWEPPLVEGIVDAGYYESIVVWEGPRRDVEPPHRMCAFADVTRECHEGIVVITASVLVGMRPWGMVF